ncbi:MAG TPA: DUF805 domain-containing protein [Pseudolabrys sp.]|nr:DUF805 domain-containing protein [Pseudolabrys sp.]
MNFGEAIKSGFTHYVTFSGRAARSEFWYWTLFAVLLSLAAGIIDRGIFDFEESTTTGVFGPLVSLALFLPGLAVSVRRLHDLDRSGWWLLLVLTLVGVILLLIWDCIKGTTGSNRFGPDPLGGG